MKNMGGAVLFLLLVGCAPLVNVEGTWEVGSVPHPCGGPTVDAPPLIIADDLPFSEAAKVFFDSLAERIGVSLKASVKNNNTCSWYTSGISYAGGRRR